MQDFLKRCPAAALGLSVVLTILFNNSNTSSGNKPVTGDSATPIVLLAAVLASVFAVIRQMKKKIR